jgi:organic hydroperoxide reductase OsmC/OhrA
MSEHGIQLSWQRETPDFAYESYDRTHLIRFSGGETLRSTAAKQYLGDPAIANPEELLVAAVSSCHMLTFLALAAKKRLILDEYMDEATGSLGKNQNGKIALVKVILRPKVKWGDSTSLSSEELESLHHKAHEHCFIAQSINCQVEVDFKV